MESFVAIMALVAALSIDRGIYFAMNSSAAATGGTIEGAAAFVNGLGLAGVDITPELLAQTASDVGEESIVSRTGGAPTLSVGLANIMAQLVGGRGLMAFWYHFAIMFEALFILTAVDAGTRVARFMLQDSIGQRRARGSGTRRGGWARGSRRRSWSPRGAPSCSWASPTRSAASTRCSRCSASPTSCSPRSPSRCAWRSSPSAGCSGTCGSWRCRSAFAAVVTITASFYKIFSDVPAIGYFAQNGAFTAARDAGETSFGTAGTPEAMDAVIRNTMIQGVLSILFVTLSIIVIVTALLATWRAYRSQASATSEDDARPSRIFAPAGLLPTPAEKELEAQWAALPHDRRPVRTGHR